jgi:hypothetical protein
VKGGLDEHADEIGAETHERSGSEASEPLLGADRDHIVLHEAAEQRWM